jgi:hypothetical protein
MTEDNIVQKIKRWKPMSKRPIGRPKTRWKDYVFGDIRSMNVNNWKKVAQNRDRWKKVVKRVRPYTACSASKEDECLFAFTRELSVALIKPLIE